MNKHLQKIIQVVDSIEQNIAIDLSVQKLAAEVNLSPWHFQRLFKSLVGDSLGGYLRGRRLTRALELLNSTELGIIDVAVEVGFSSHEAFTRSFKQKFNYSPKEYRLIQNANVITTKKPLLSLDLFDHIHEGISKEPEIVEIPAIYLSGYSTNIPSPFETDENICEIIAEPWWKLLKHKKEGEAKNYMGVTLSPSGNFTEKELKFICSEVYHDKEQMIDAEMTYEIPKQKMASFKIHSNIEEDIARKTIDYIYGYWFSNSKYKRGTGHDYEFFGNVVDFMNPGSFDYRYMVPIEDD